MNNGFGGARLLPLAIGLIVILFLAARGCQEGPFGRSQLVRLTPAQEDRLGAQAFRQVLDESVVIPRGAAVDEIDHIGRRLAAATQNPEFLRLVKIKQPPHFDWQFRLVRDKQVNAFCLPGGKVVVYTGILPVAETDAGLATVMGHEIGHALARHGAERMAQNELVQIGTVAVAASLGDMDRDQQRLVLGLLGAGTQFGVLLPFSRKHESEADHIGILLMAAAGYDPRDAPKLWVRMERSGGKGPPEFMSTHPSHATRIRDLEKWVPEAMPLYKASQPQPNRPLPLPGAPSERPRPAGREPTKGKGYEFK